MYLTIINIEYMFDLRGFLSRRKKARIPSGKLEEDLNELIEMLSK